MAQRASQPTGRRRKLGRGEAAGIAGLVVVDASTPGGWDGSRFLLLAVPLAIGLRFAGRPADLAVRRRPALAIIPLAGLMGESTEQLAHRLGPGIGGLLNATFGNAAELIIALFALFNGLDEVVKASLTGSIIGNLLLVLGASLLAGGLKFNDPAVQPDGRGGRLDDDGAGADRHAGAGDLPRTAGGDAGPDLILEHELSIGVSSS